MSNNAKIYPRVFVVHTDWVIRSCEHGSDLSAFPSFEEAKKQYNSTVEQIKKEVYPEVFADIENSDFDVDEDIEAGSFSVYRTGEYIEEHYDVDIVELLVGFFDVKKGGC